MSQRCRPIYINFCMQVYLAKLKCINSFFVLKMNFLFKFYCCIHMINRTKDHTPSPKRKTVPTSAPLICTFVALLCYTTYIPFLVLDLGIIIYISWTTFFLKEHDQNPAKIYPSHMKYECHRGNWFSIEVYYFIYNWKFF